MKTTSFILTNKREVFISIAETPEDDKQLGVIVRETKYICSISKRTGLYIVAEFSHQERKVVVMSLGELIVLSDQELQNVKDEILKI